MIVRVIQVFIKEEFTDEFEKVTLENHRGSLQEPGVLRFDVLKDPDRPGEYLLYEVYRSEQATLDHKETEHYARWKEAVGPMMSRDRVGMAYEPLAPTDEGSW